ncbi:MAG: hypothetical protein AAB468_00195 [Patescibacteria group bacterium]
MILATHAVVGAGLVSLMSTESVAGGFGLAFASHFLLDSLPHWDYQLLSTNKHPGDRLRVVFNSGRALIVDLTKISLDGIVGLTFAMLIFTPWPLAALGAAAAMLPDALQMAYFLWSHEPLRSLQRFHLWIHTDRRLVGRPYVGLAFQALVLVVFIIFTKAVL